jgi:hypothetical protein
MGSTVRSAMTFMVTSLEGGSRGVYHRRRHRAAAVIARN